MSAHKAATAWSARPARPATRVQLGEPPSVALLMLERLDLLVVVLTLFACLLAFQEPLTWLYGALAAAAVALCGRLITPPDLERGAAPAAVARRAVPKLLAEWATIVGLLLLAGASLNVADDFSRPVISTWVGVTAVALVLTQFLQAQVARWLHARGGLATRYVVVGVTGIGREIVRRIPERSFLGYFDFRGPQRLQGPDGSSLEVRPCRELGDFVRARGVSAVYIALPIGNSPRIQELLADLRDTTASIYFVPDVLAFDLIQGRVVDLGGIPALAICDTPLKGTNAFAKRALDLTLTLLAAPLVLPVCLLIGAAVKLTSRGPMLFAQRRYGMDGAEILVYKFRSMTVCEDGGEIRQASRSDQRITPLGRLLRRTSLDELPQLINVLQGKMSLVGPRPHAVSHNELYRRQISGYMVRHKALPGLTGWAQVHGLRGETDTVEKMAQRVRYDLEYLRDWSISLDLRILWRTVWVVARGDNAF
ncbi:MAG: undecaprenyl-phosphate glucose phosphotransferase [Proteobacteria bacterium]|nr:undecaprenyl-phosphate glucose phosphotransferase [Pseudomonadota bacterium]